MLFFKGIFKSQIISDSYSGLWLESWQEYYPNSFTLILNFFNEIEKELDFGQVLEITEKFWTRLTRQRIGSSDILP